MASRGSGLAGRQAGCPGIGAATWAPDHGRSPPSAAVNARIRHGSRAAYGRNEHAHLPVGPCAVPGAHRPPDPLPPPSFKYRVKALLEGNPPADLPEHLFTAAMRARGMARIDFLGGKPGMWSLHPPYRCPDFFAKLPSLISRIETGDIPEEQKGDHDVNSSLVDWSEAVEALRRNRWWNRLSRRWLG